MIISRRGLGTGFPRALREWPTIELVDDVDANQFRVIVQRPGSSHSTGEVTPEVTPEVAPEVAPEVISLLGVLYGEMARGELMAELGLKDQKHFREAYLRPALEGGMIEMTVPDKPRSSRQRYRLTAAGLKAQKHNGRQP